MIDAIHAAQERAKRSPIKQRKLLAAFEQMYNVFVGMGMKDPEPPVEKPVKVFPPTSRAVILAADSSKNFASQVDRLVSLGYPNKLGVSEELYRMHMPDEQPQPVEFKSKFDILLLVDPRATLGDQMELLDITGSRKKGIYQVAERQRAFLNAPYQIWIQFGESGISSADAMKGFSDNEKPLTLLEGFALIREYPQIIKAGPVRLMETIYRDPSWHHDGQEYASLGRRARYTASFDVNFISGGNAATGRTVYYPTKGIVT